jgi:hypothetical protein
MISPVRRQVAQLRGEDAHPFLSPERSRTGEAARGTRAGLVNGAPDIDARRSAPCQGGATGIGTGMADQSPWSLDPVAERRFPGGGSVRAVAASQGAEEPARPPAENSQR